MRLFAPRKSPEASLCSKPAFLKPKVPVEEWQKWNQVGDEWISVGSWGFHLLRRGLPCEVFIEGSGLDALWNSKGLRLRDVFLLRKHLIFLWHKHFYGENAEAFKLLGTAPELFFTVGILDFPYSILAILRCKFSTFGRSFICITIDDRWNIDQILAFGWLVNHHVFFHSTGSQDHHCRRGRPLSNFRKNSSTYIFETLQVGWTPLPSWAQKTSF